MDKLKMQTENIADKNFEILSKMFPNALTETITGYDNDGKPIVERAIDADVLRQEISCRVVEGKDERYQFTWPDKKKAVLLANAPIDKTLRPCREESVDFDNTENLYIEGDNLEVLKLLQETYLGKIKMIYIDPPYNTGNDFVYEDDFAQSMDEYRENSGQFDGDGNRLVKNIESNGRFHTDWLNMMYSRLKIARALLSEKGAMFISIDDNEYDNLKKMCDEIFGERMFVTSIIWQKKTGASDAKGIATITENVLVYVKNIDEIDKVFTQNTDSYDLKRYKYTDEFIDERGPYYIDNLDRGGLSYSDSLNYGIECPDGTITFPNGRSDYVNDGWIWKWGRQKIEWARKNKFIEFRRSTSKKSGWAVCYKNYLKVDNEGKIIERAAPHKNLIIDVLNANASSTMKELFSTNNYFSYAKPVELIQKLISFVRFEDNDIFLDYFSGSATSAQAIMNINDDNIKRKYILIQIREEYQEKDEAFKNGYKTICDLGEERIRRARRQISRDSVDTGFRVLKLDSSNMKDIYYAPFETQQSLFDTYADNIKEDRTSEDLLFQVMLDLGVLLSSKIEETTIAGKQVFNVADGFLIACFDKDVTEETVKAVAEKKPYYAVFRDSSMASDSVATNFDQIFASISPETVRKVL